MNFGGIHPYIAQFWQDSAFWKQKTQIGFGIKVENAEEYLKIVTRHGKVYIGSERFISTDEFTKRAIQQGKEKELQYILDVGFKNWNLALYESAKANFHPWIYHFLSLYPNYQKVHSTENILNCLITFIDWHMLIIIGIGIF